MDGGLSLLAFDWSQLEFHNYRYLVQSLFGIYTPPVALSLGLKRIISLGR